MTTTEVASIVGSASGLITVLSFIPQCIRVFRTRRTQDLSSGTFVLLILQASGWTAYGMLLKQNPIIWTNVCVLVLTIAILSAKLKHG
jgi:MtN3 and saliva related transmembrane protein